MRMARFLIFSLVMMATALVDASPNRFYRYVDDSGTTVIRSTISPERAAQGYDVIDHNGRLVETVEPRASEEELAERQRQRELDQEREIQAREQERYDLSLLQNYSFVADIEAEKRRQVAQQQTQVAVLRGNLSSFRADLEKAYEEAAVSERRNHKVSESVQNRIDNLEERISNTEQMLEKQLEDIELTRERYRRAINRFKQLEELRNRRSSVNQ